MFRNEGIIAKICFFTGDVIELLQMNSTGNHFGKDQSTQSARRMGWDQGSHVSPYSNVSISANAEEEEGSSEKPQKSGRVAATLSRR